MLSLDLVYFAYAAKGNVVGRLCLFRFGKEAKFKGTKLKERKMQFPERSEGLGGKTSKWRHGPIQPTGMSIDERIRHFDM